MLEHIRTCRQCSGLYQDCAVHLSDWNADVSPFEVPAAVLDAGRGVAEAPDDPVSGKGTQRGGGFPGWPRPLKLAGAAAALVLVVVTVLWVKPWEGGEVSQSVDPSLLAPVRLAAEMATGMGAIVIPGGEAGIDRSDEVPFRSACVPVSDALRASLDRLYEMYRDAPTPEVAHWLIAGHVATGHVGLARDLAFDAEQQFPGDERIAVLAGIVALSDDNHDDAVRALREVTESDSDPTAEINLAVALIEAGRDDEARSMLEGLAKDSTDVRIARRAASLLAAID